MLTNTNIFHDIYSQASHKQMEDFCYSETEWTPNLQLEEISFW